MNYIGEMVKQRMTSLDINIDELADKAFMEISTIKDIIDDKVSYEEIDEFDMDLISSVLHCEKEYFIDSTIRNKDLINSAQNRGNDTKKSLLVKAKIQNYMNDYAFVSEVLSEEMSQEVEGCQ